MIKQCIETHSDKVGLHGMGEEVRLDVQHDVFEVHGCDEAWARLVKHLECLDCMLLVEVLQTSVTLAWWEYAWSPLDYAKELILEGDSVAWLVKETLGSVKRSGELI